MAKTDRSLPLRLAASACFLAVTVGLVIWLLGDLARMNSWQGFLPVLSLGLCLYCAHSAFLAWAQAKSPPRQED